VVLSQSRAQMELVVREGICGRDKIRFLGNGIDLARFDRRRLDGGEVAQVRQELGLPPGAPVVGFVGRLVAEKGVPELLAAGRTVREQVPGTHFLFVGPLDGEKADALTPEAARAYGVADACVFAGLRQDMPQLYALMDLFVLPSHRESFPRSPLEAAAMEVPCVATDIPGCREAVEDGVNGLLVPAGNVQALAGAIIRLLADGAMAQRMGRAGRRLAEERFDERMVFARVKDEYARLLQEKGLPVPRGGGQVVTLVG
jgi:glycosyltransferase involved in cell wall biosynthesis